MSCNVCRFLWFAVLPAVVLPSQALAQGIERPAAEPGISPDGSEIAFVSGGDIWTVPSTGGTAGLLVSHPAHESTPRFSPDGMQLAFSSDRTGNGDIYVLDFATGRVRRITYGDGADQLDGWSFDSEWIYFTSNAEDIAGMNDVFRVRASGGTPMRVAGDRYLSEYFGAAGPDGATLAISALGIGAGQWWRNGHSHIDESDIYLVNISPVLEYRQFAGGGGKTLWPMWSADGQVLYFMSDRTGTENLWRKSLTGGDEEQLTDFSSGRLIWPTISAAGNKIAFERDFGIWVFDTNTRRSSRVGVEFRGAVEQPVVEAKVFTQDFSELALSPDGEKIAVIAHGEVFAAAAEAGGAAFRVTHTTARESDVVWSTDSRSIFYASLRDGESQIFVYDFLTNEERKLTDVAAGAWAPSPSPGGESLAFVVGGDEIWTASVSGEGATKVAALPLWRPPLGPSRPLEWAPDGNWIAVASSIDGRFRNVVLVGVATETVRPVSFLANGFAGGVSWSPDGSFVVFGTSQRTETRDVARVDLIQRTVPFREEMFDSLFSETDIRNSSNARSFFPTDFGSDGEGLSIEWEGIRDRLTLLPTGLDVTDQIIAPDGKSLVLVASAEGQQNVYSFPLDELSSSPSIPRQLTSTPGRKSFVQFSSDGSELFLLDRGRVQRVNVRTGSTSGVTLRAEMEVDFSELRGALFWEAWSFLRDHFYDEQFHGTDWSAVRERWQSVVDGTSTPMELRRVLSLMVGELNASHLGVRSPSGGVSSGGGRLGIDFDRALYESEGRFVITHIVAQGPVDLADDVDLGDEIRAVDGTELSQSVDLASYLANTVGDRVMVRLLDVSTGVVRPVSIKPVSLGVEKSLRYREWVQSRRAYVERISGGRLGYVHMRNMSADALRQLYVDLDAENHDREGVVVDLRNNSGGFVNAYALDVFSRRPYLWMTVRDGSTVPARTNLGQRALERPTVLVTNRHSLSDAEDFTEGYRELGLGKVVGEETAGWIIYTWNATLVDGTTLRLPRTRVTTNEGVTMELSPRPVDVAVSRAVGESYRGEDAELDAAVEVLISQLDANRN